MGDQSGDSCTKDSKTIVNIKYILIFNIYILYESCKHDSVSFFFHFIVLLHIFC